MVAQASANFSFRLLLILLLDITKMLSGGSHTSFYTQTHNEQKKKNRKKKKGEKLFSFSTELVQGIRRQFSSVSVFGITSDPASYSQPIISFQLSQHLFCVLCLLWDSHLRYPLEQPEGSFLQVCSAPLSFLSQKWTLSLLSTSTYESAEVAHSPKLQSYCQATGLSALNFNQICRFKKKKILQNIRVWFLEKISGFGA